MWDPNSYIAFVVVGLIGFELDAGYSLRRKGRDADDISVSDEHQHIDDNGGGPAPCTDFAGPELISPSGNCCEWNDGGLRRKRLPGSAEKTPALSVDRYCPGESDDGPNREKDARGNIAGANQVHERPEADARQERMPGDPHDALRWLREAIFLGD